MAPSAFSGDPARWPSTCWPDIDALRAASPARRRRLLDKLIQTYQAPVLEYLLALGFSLHDAEDARQQFLQIILNHRRLFERADNGRGRLRDFIRRALRHFAANLRRDAHAIKRGGRAVHIGLEAAHPLPAATLTPQESFEHSWAQGVITRTEAWLAAETILRRGSQFWETLRPYLEGWHGPKSQAAAAARLGLTATALSTELSRLRQRYRHILFVIVSETAITPSEAEADLSCLRRILSR